MPTTATTIETTHVSSSGRQTSLNTGREQHGDREEERSR